MTIQAATPYLILNGKAKDAIELYRSALGANVEAIQRFGDMPGSCPEAMKEQVRQLDERARLAEAADEEAQAADEAATETAAADQAAPEGDEAPAQDAPAGEGTGIAAAE